MAKAARLFVVFGAALVISGCVREFSVNAVGSVESLTFEFRSNGRQGLEFHSVTSAFVQEWRAGVWEPVWQLSGQASADRIRYGSPPAGLETKVPARPLAQNGVYRIVVRDAVPGQPPGSAVLYWTFNHSGQATAIEPLPESIGR